MTQTDSAHSFSPTSISSASQRPDTLWFTRCPVPCATGIAVANGWLDDAFEPLGVRVQSLRNSPDRHIRESHFTHTLENSFRQGGNAPAIYAKSQGEDTVLLGLQWTPQYQAILTLPESGIKTVSDLKGRRLSLPKRVNDKIDFWRAISLQGYEHALSMAQLGLDDVELVDLPVLQSFVDTASGDKHGIASVPQLQRHHTAELTALLQGRVDAIFAYSVWGLTLRDQFNAVQVINLAQTPDPFLQVNNEQPSTLTVSGKLLREHPDVVDRYVAQLVRASHWARNNRNASRIALAQETGTSEYWIDEGHSPDITDRLDLSLDGHLVNALAKRKNFLLQHGFIPQDIDLDRWIDSGPLDRALRDFAHESLRPANTA